MAHADTRLPCFARARETFRYLRLPLLGHAQHVVRHTHLDRAGLIGRIPHNASVRRHCEHLRDDSKTASAIRLEPARSAVMFAQEYCEGIFESSLTKGLWKEISSTHEIA